MSDRIDLSTMVESSMEWPKWTHPTRWLCLGCCPQKLSRTCYHIAIDSMALRFTRSPAAKTLSRKWGAVPRTQNVAQFMFTVLLWVSYGEVWRLLCGCHVRIYAYMKFTHPLIRHICPWLLYEYQVNRE